MTMKLTLHNVQALLPDIVGVYGIWFFQRCIYIGQSLDIRYRLMQHIKHCHNEKLEMWIAAYGGKLSVCHQPVPKDALDQVEQSLIHRLWPCANKTHNLLRTEH